MTPHILTLLALTFFAVCILTTVFMFVSIGKQGDERRKMMILRASANTFIILALSTLFQIVEGVFRSVAQGLPMEGENPVVSLIVMSIVFTANLLYYRRELGG